MTEIPARITQAWIEKTVPELTEQELEQLIGVMRERNWTDDDFSHRVFPHVLHPLSDAHAVPKPDLVAARSQTESVELRCIRGHVSPHSTSPRGDYIEGKCPTCGRPLLAIANVLCRGLTRERTYRTKGLTGPITSTSRTYVSVTVRIRYRRPDPPPEENIVLFGLNNSGEGIQIRSGDRISIMFRRGRTGKPRPYMLISHTLGIRWKLNNSFP